MIFYPFVFLYSCSKSSSVDKKEYPEIEESACEGELWKSLKFESNELNIITYSKKGCIKFVKRLMDGKLIVCKYVYIQIEI